VYKTDDAVYPCQTSVWLKRKKKRKTQNSLTLADVINATPPKCLCIPDSSVIICMLCTAEQTIANEDEGVEGLTGKRTVIATQSQCANIWSE